LATRGAAICVSYAARTAEAEAAAAENAADGGCVIAIQADVADADSVARMVTRTEAELGPVSHQGVFPFYKREARRQAHAAAASLALCVAATQASAGRTSFVGERSASKRRKFERNSSCSLEKLNFTDVSRMRIRSEYGRLLPPAHRRDGRIDPEVRDVLLMGRQHGDTNTVSATPSRPSQCGIEPWEPLKCRPDLTAPSRVPCAGKE
jgi:NAD(P)-dependent dehydrogenase (short-subunit alcohol dehydrogenase family)